VTGRLFHDRCYAFVGSTYGRCGAAAKHAALMHKSRLPLVHAARIRADLPIVGQEQTRASQSFFLGDRSGDGTVPARERFPSLG
jgi:hypothetical protein